jgi:hypothetical protein
MLSTGGENLIQPSRSIVLFELPEAHRLRSDQDAMQAAHQIAGELKAEASARDRERRRPHAEIELLTRSGLFGITRMISSRSGSALATWKNQDRCLCRDTQSARPPASRHSNKRPPFPQ